LDARRRCPIEHIQIHEPFDFFSGLFLEYPAQASRIGFADNVSALTYASATGSLQRSPLAIMAQAAILLASAIAATFGAPSARLARADAWCHG
jgi:hypothetical protein